ncbi:MAG: hypothetical protein J6V50_00060, partial [Clostridia bacterium]|nr:hypothetical protein [Clostridia bacterium]
MKLFKQALSLALSVLLVASALFVGVSAEDLTKTVNATALDVVTYNSARNATVGNPLYIESFKAGNDNNPLVPELSSDRFTFTWDKENNSLKSVSLAEFSADASMSDSKIYTLYEYQPLSLDLTKDKASQLIEINGENSGLMFYI